MIGRWECKKHPGRFVKPSQQRLNRKTGCSLCDNLYRRTPEARLRREEKWKKEFIPCIRHANRKCNRSEYVRNGRRKCGSCTTRLVNGARKRREVNKRHREQNQRNYDLSINRRFKYYAGRLRGLALYERVTGLDLVSLGFAR